MRTYGYEIVQTLIVDIEPDATVKHAMNEINAGTVPFVDLNLVSIFNLLEHSFKDMGKIQSDMSVGTECIRASGIFA